MPPGLAGLDRVSRQPPGCDAADDAALHRTRSNRLPVATQLTLLHTTVDGVAGKIEVEVMLKRLTLLHTTVDGEAGKLEGEVMLMDMPGLAVAPASIPVVL